MVPRFLKGIHWPLVILGFVLTGIGIIAIYSASFRTGGDFAAKQLIWLGVAAVVFLVTVWIGYRPILSLGYILYGFSIVLLIIVLILGEARSGAHRWINIGSFALQPSELAKIASVMALANFLADRSCMTGQTKTLILSSFLFILPFGLILKQPDLGSALVLMPAFAAILFFWGVRVRYYIMLAIGAILSAPVAWNLLKPYQQKRILVFLNPSIDPIGVSYTAIQSKIAVGSGGVFGKGWLHGTQNQLNFVPEHHTDFIFSVIGEEAGFLGALLIILLFGAFLGYALQIIHHTTDQRARLMVIGIVSIIFFQVFVNIGMTIGLAPITGITLPFLSYGGSSLVASFFAIGLLTSVYRERSIF